MHTDTLLGEFGPYSAYLNEDEDELDLYKADEDGCEELIYTERVDENTDLQERIEDLEEWYRESAWAKNDWMDYTGSSDEEELSDYYDSDDPD